MHTLYIGKSKLSKTALIVVPPALVVRFSRRFIDNSLIGTLLALCTESEQDQLDQLLKSNISMHIPHTVLCWVLMIPIRRIWLTIKSFLRKRSFPLFSWPTSFVHGISFISSSFFEGWIGEIFAWRQKIFAVRFAYSHYLLTCPLQNNELDPKVRQQTYPPHVQYCSVVVLSWQLRVPRASRFFAVCTGGAEK